MLRICDVCGKFYVDFNSGFRIRHILTGGSVSFGRYEISTYFLFFKPNWRIFLWQEIIFWKKIIYTNLTFLQTFKTKLRDAVWQADSQGYRPLQGGCWARGLTLRGQLQRGRGQGRWDRGGHGLWPGPPIIPTG